MKYYDNQIHNKGEGDDRPQPFKIFFIHCNHGLPDLTNTLNGPLFRKYLYGQALTPQEHTSTFFAHRPERIQYNSQDLPMSLETQNFLFS